MEKVDPLILYMRRRAEEAARKQISLEEAARTYRIETALADACHISRNNPRGIAFPADERPAARLLKPARSVRRSL